MLFIKQEQFISQADEAITLDDNELKEEGHLAVDIYQKPGFIVIRSTIAGAQPEDIEIVVDGDMLTIRGVRHEPEVVEYSDFLYRECYWGKFSRTVILPISINETKIDSSFDNGVLTIVLETSE